VCVVLLLLLMLGSAPQDFSRFGILAPDAQTHRFVGSNHPSSFLLIPGEAKNWVHWTAIRSLRGLLHN